MNTDLGLTLAEQIINLHVELLPEGCYLATSEAIPGLVAQGRTVAETLDIARDVAKRLLEARAERGELTKAELRIQAARHGCSMEDEASGGVGSRIHAHFAQLGGVELELLDRRGREPVIVLDTNVLLEAEAT
jgi:predicted RNase H-like HicB family nuclease